MTAFTLSAGGTTNWDTLSGGSVNATLDTYTISNNTTLVIDTDSYQCANHSVAFGSLDTVTYAGVGGRLKLDGKNVRVIPFNTGTGTVPAIGTAVTQGGVSATLLGVWSSWQTEPLAAAAAMPATGWIKVKNKTGGNYAAGLVMGVVATATGPDVIGWIEVRGADLATITVPRIGVFETDGDWFELGTTNGTRGQVLECPTTATIAAAFPGVWIETAAASGVYERFPSCGSMVNLATNPTDERGKIIWQTTAGIRIGSDGVNNVGFLPPTGCRVRIPNVIMTCCTRTVSGSGARVLPNATLATRQEFDTTSAGDIQLVGCVMQWYGNFLQSFRVKLLNVAIGDSLVLSEVSSPMDALNVIVAPTQAQINFALNMASCFSGGTMADMNIIRFSLAASANYVCVVNFCTGITFSNVKTQPVTERLNASTGGWTISLSSSCTWSGCTLIGGRVLVTTGDQLVFLNTKYADRFVGLTTTLLPYSAFDFTNAANNVRVDGFQLLLADTNPYDGIVRINSCADFKLRNIGSRAAPLNLGTANPAGVIINAIGNSKNIKLQRIYVINTRTGPWILTNSENNVIIENVYADYADTSIIAALNCQAKSVALVGTTVGQISVYGTHWKSSFTSATVGKIEILCNEPTASSALQCAITSGTPKFNSAGQVALTIVGQQVVWEMPFFALGMTALANLAPTITGTTTGNLNYEFQFDIGAGYNGSWLTLNAANQNAVGAINPLIGINLKIRATCATAAAGNLLTNIAIPAVTTAVDQGDSLYPLDLLTVTLSGLQVGTDIVVLLAGTGTIVTAVDQHVSSSYNYNYTTAGVAVDIGFHKAGYVPQYIRNYTLPASNASLPITQVADRNYV